MHRSWLLLGCGAWFAACTLDFGRFEAPEAAAAQSSSTAATGGTSSVSTGPGPGGAGGSPQSSSASAGGGTPNCDAQYGDATNYVACLEDAMVCEFNAEAQNESCSDICEARGGECIEVFNDNGPCGHGQQLTCNTQNFVSLICVCSKGCGGGPPCSASQTCNNGNCN
jgi:hypothetical protein